MKQPNYQKILNKKADDFINDYVTQDISPTMKGAERASYKVGFIDCYKEFGVPKMIDALAGAYDELSDLMERAHWTKEAENKELIAKIEQALENAGAEL